MFSERDMSEFTLARLFTKVGRKFRVLVRFSTVAGGRESADTVRDPRGFAVRFYTEDGIHDIVCNNTPVFFIRDPMKFPDFIHSQKKNPVTNLTDNNAQWDFFSLTPESLNQVTVLFSDQAAYIAHVGDSRVYLKRQQTLVQATHETRRPVLMLDGVFSTFAEHWFPNDVPMAQAVVNIYAESCGRVLGVKI